MRKQRRQMNRRQSFDSDGCDQSRQSAGAGHQQGLAAGVVNVDVKAAEFSRNASRDGAIRRHQRGCAIRRLQRFAHE